MMNFDNISALGENDTHVVDLSGKGNNGTVIGGSVTTTDTHLGIGRAMQFDGVNDYINLGDNTSYKQDDFTIESIDYLANSVEINVYDEAKILTKDDTL